MSGHGYSSSSSHKYIPRRAVLYVPGNDEKKIKKIPSLHVDCAVLDCEDGVAVNKKVMAWFSFLGWEKTGIEIWCFLSSIAHYLERLYCSPFSLITNISLTQPWYGFLMCLFSLGEKKNPTKMYLKSWPSICDCVYVEKRHRNNPFWLWYLLVWESDLILELWYKFFRPVRCN